MTEQFRASIRGLNVSENRRSGTYEIQLTISVVSNLELNKVIAGIRSIRSVTRISRI